MQTDPKELQNLVDTHTDASGGPKAQGDAAKASLPNAKRYSDQIVSSQFSDRTSPKK